ncbi:putative methyltransferase [Novymonas esmeraldas]|uniref:Methyltransferase n=1 Tax=Novymonas esmeraldas TaxID=1808958 RepID=A0AAW0EUM4_9TRYP
MPFAVSHPCDTAERVEGEPFFKLATYTLQPPPASTAQDTTELVVHVRAFDVLPLCDAVGLLSGTDATGLIVWGGALALLEWLARHPQRLRARLLAAPSNDVAHFIELGCGSGVLAVGLCTLLRDTVLPGEAELRPSLAARVWATDGNPECVSLAQRNLDEQHSARGGSSDGVAASAVLLPWGDAAAVHHLHHAHIFAAAASLIILSADVLYDAAAVPLLVSTVADIAATCGSSSGTAAAPLPVEWWLAYTPRSLTRESNERIFNALLDAIAQRRWSYELADLPAGSVASGFENRADCATPALLGCILVVQVSGSSVHR